MVSCCNLCSLSPPALFLWLFPGGASFLEHFSICVVCLSCCIACSLQPCGHLPGSANLLDLLYVMFSYVVLTFPFGVLDQMWYSIALIPDICLLPYIDFIGISDFRRERFYDG